MSEKNNHIHRYTLYLCIWLFLLLHTAHKKFQKDISYENLSFIPHKHLPAYYLATYIDVPPTYTRNLQFEPLNPSWSTSDWPVKIIWGLCKHEHWLLSFLFSSIREFAARISRTFGLYRLPILKLTIADRLAWVFFDWKVKKMLFFVAVDLSKVTVLLNTVTFRSVENESKYGSI